MRLFQFDRPVRMVEELFPAFVSLVSEVNMQQGVASWLYGFCDQRHICLFRGSTAFFDVACHAGADNIFPCAFTADTSRHYVVEGQLARREFLSAILAVVFVTRENVSAVEFYFASR